MKLTINELGMIKNLRVVFTNKKKVFSELIQNARRAGATAVHIETIEHSDSECTVSIRDNGCGVQNFKKLFTVAESDWGDDIVNREAPYGMGFMSVMFAAPEVSIESLGKAVTFDTEAVLNGLEFEPQSTTTDNSQTGTIVTLHRTAFTESWLKQTLIEVIKYSELPLYLNGERIEPSHSESMIAMSSAWTFQSQYGTWYLRDLNPAAFSVVLQEIPVYHARGYERTSYLFANERLTARMPDRDLLINEEEVIQLLKDDLAQFVRAALEQELASLGCEAFLNRHYHAALRKHPALLNQIPMLPMRAFSVARYPSLRDEDAYYASHVDSEFVKQGGHEVIIDSDDPENIGVFPAIYAYEKSAIVFDELNSLDKEHWLHQQMTNLRDLDFEVTFERQVGFNVTLDTNWLPVNDNGSIGIGKTIITVKQTGDSVELSSGLSLSEMPESSDCDHDHVNVKVCASINEHALILPALNSASVEAALLMWSSYTEDEMWRDDLVEIDVQCVLQQGEAHLCDNTADALAIYLKSMPLPVRALFRGQKFAVDVADNDDIVVQLAS